LHPAEIALLTAAVSKDRRIQVFHADGLQSWIRLLPTNERRGLVLINPSYEIKSDYTQATEALIKMHKRFARRAFTHSGITSWNAVASREAERIYHNVVE
jgi:23S rRNA (adenine2030-N6)-methyltransferase